MELVKLEAAVSQVVLPEFMIVVDIRLLMEKSGTRCAQLQPINTTTMASDGSRTI